MSDEREPFGLVAAAQRARAWMPLLRTDGQRLVLAAVVLHMNADSTADPSIAGQLATVTGYSTRSVRRILRQLEEQGALVAVGSRPVFTAEGLARGGKVTLWSIPPGPVSPSGTQSHPDSQVLVGDSQPDPGARPIGLGSAPTRTQLGPPLIAEISESGDSVGDQEVDSVACEEGGHDFVRVGKTEHCRNCRAKADVTGNVGEVSDDSLPEMLERLTPHERIVRVFDAEVVEVRAKP